MHVHRLRHLETVVGENSIDNTVDGEPSKDRKADSHVSRVDGCPLLVLHINFLLQRLHLPLSGRLVL